MKRELTLDILSFLFIILFAFAALSKIFDNERFATQIAQSPFISNYVWLSKVIPSIELVVALLLCVPRIRTVSMIASFAIMLSFFAFTVAITGFSDIIPCTCSGIIPGVGWIGHLTFNFVFTILSAFGIYVCFSDSKFIPV